MIAVHQIYTFGGPMIGNAPAIAAIDREFAGRIFRYVNLPDPVPMLPMMSLLANQYAHCRQEFPLGQSKRTRGPRRSGPLISEALAKRTTAHGIFEPRL